METAINGLIQYQHADDIAIRFKDQTISYAQLVKSINRLTHGLVNIGIKPGDRIAFFLLNCPELIICYYACWEIGAIATPINNRIKGPEITRVIQQVEPTIIISQNSLLEELQRACMQTDYSLANCFLIDENENNNTKSFSDLMISTMHDLPEFDDQQDALIHFTSGTTATPKAVVHRQQQVNNIARVSAEYMHYTPNDNVIVALSLAHGFAYSMQMLPCLHAGGSLTLLPKFNPKKTFELITEQDTSGICLLPSMCFQLLKLAKQSGSFHHHLRFCLVAGDAIPMALQTRFRNIFGMPITANYGLTESVLTCLMPHNSTEKLGSVGLPIDANIAVIDEENNFLTSGEVGEIVVKNKNMMAYYWGLPKLTKQSLRKGWLHTDDLGMLDEDGYVWFKGRKKLVIIRGGSNISPQEIEAACYQHQDVLEAGVIGIQDDELGQRVQAFIVLTEGSDLTEETLQAFLRSQLADYKIPDKIIFISRLPKTGVGKIDRRQLAKLAEKQAISLS